MSIFRRITPVILFFFGVQLSHAQYIEIGTSIGFATYQGDINPLSSRLSVQGARFAKGLAIGYNFNQAIGVKIRFMDSYLEAYDNSSFNEGRRNRNFHFKSDLKEYSIAIESELLNLIPYFRGWKYRPYLSAGVGFFRFNPKAKHHGIWHELQPLGTEGQGMAGHGDKYSLTQLTIPLGFGMRYHLNKNVILSFEVSPRITFTDYIDDVSTDYPDLDQLREENGDLAAIFSYRGNPNRDPSGTRRGNPSENDWYMTSTITFTYRLDPEFTVNKKHKFAGYYRCPFN